LPVVPVKHPRDFLAISNFRALKLGIQAVKLEEANDDAAAQVKWLLAVKELNLEHDDEQPKKQEPIRINLGRVLTNPI